MPLGSSAASSSVSFPVSDSPQNQRQGNQGPPVKVPHLPFRRISLPTVPSLLHRVSVVSVASFDPFTEGGPTQIARPQVKPPLPSYSASGTKPTQSQSQSRPVSIASPGRRRNPRRDSSVKPLVVDDKLAAKCRKVIDEFYETEKAYVDGLELIYSHFLTPIITSLDTPEPLLNRSALTSIFSNFIDIWNLHRSFLAALTSLLEPAQQHDTSASVTTSSPAPTTKPSSDSASAAPLPKLSPLLLAHFPYLSLYTPFITAFPSTISALNDLITPPSAFRPNPQYNSRFATFLATQESDVRCNKLKMRDWLLTIVQRCPRYLLLLKDLINSTNKEDPEHAQLTAVHTLVSKITLSLNTSLQTHAQTLSLLALQKATTNLPAGFQLISPGRTFLKRGCLLQAERSEDPVGREFLLFSDCLVWLANASGSAGGESGSGSLGSWDWGWSGSGSGSGVSGSGSGSGSGGVGVTQSHHNTPVSKSKSRLGANEKVEMKRTRSKSDAEIETMRSGMPSSLFRKNQREGEASERVPVPDNEDGLPASSSRPVTPTRRNGKVTPAVSAPPPPPNMVKRNNNNTSTSSGSTDSDKWVYKGRVELIDAQIIVGSALEDERKFEVLSPEGSFVLYAASASERDEWTTELRQAKSQLLVTLNITHPNSTLTSSASTNHVRRALQALPYHPSDDRLASLRLRGSSSMGDVDALGGGASYGSSSGGLKARGRFGRKDKHKEKVKTKDKEKDNDKSKETPSKTPLSRTSERRRKVDHWVPAIWIPDGKTSSCMRCGRMFGWRRRRHHCRLCGRCVCAGCSGQTFYITDANSNKPEASTKPARACDACYESVFPLIHPSNPGSEYEYELPESSELNNRNSDSEDIKFFAEGRGQDHGKEMMKDDDSEDVNDKSAGADTIASLSRLHLNLPSWLSMPVLPVHVQDQQQQHHSKHPHQREIEPHALMDIDLNKARDFLVDLELGPGAGGNGNDGGGEVDDHVRDQRRARLRMKSPSHQKLRSYHEILEDFEKAQQQQRVQGSGNGNPAEEELVLEAREEEDKFPISISGDEKPYGYYHKADDRDPVDYRGVGGAGDIEEGLAEQEDEEVEEDEEEDQDQIEDIWFTPTHSLASSPVSSPSRTRPLQRRGEDTARRSKRFSLPAIALHTTSVTARTSSSVDIGSMPIGGGGGGAEPLSRESSSGEPIVRPSRRFSLVSGLGGGRSRNSLYTTGPDGNVVAGSPTRSRTSGNTGAAGNLNDPSVSVVGDLARGLAAARLSELLGRKTSVN